MTRQLVLLAAALLAPFGSASCLRYGELSARFDERAPAAVESRTVTGRSGETVTLVRTAVNGEDLGWFMLVSGSYYTIIDTKFVSRLDDFPQHSEIAIPYPCKLPVALHRARTLTVGRLTLRNADIASFDLSGALDDFDVEIAGMIGFPVFQHSVVKIEYGGEGADDRVSVYDPDRFELEDGKWQPLGIVTFQPVLLSRVNRRTRAPFVLDTGFGGGVSFYSVFAANNNVLEDRPATERTVRTLCGDAKVMDSTVRVFEIAGVTYEDLAVSVKTPGSIYDVASGRMGGTIGRDFLRRFDVVFDCPNQRIALTGR